VTSQVQQTAPEPDEGIACNARCRTTIVAHQTAPSNLGNQSHSTLRDRREPELPTQLERLLPAKTSEIRSEAQSHSRNQPLALQTPPLNFRFLKHPLLIGGIYVQSVRRAEALAYVFLLALLVAAYIQMKIRKALKERRQTVELEGKRITDRPTIRAILDLLNRVQVVRVETHEGVTRILPRNVDQRALRMIELAGYDTAIYTTKVS